MRVRHLYPRLSLSAGLLRDLLPGMQGRIPLSFGASLGSGLIDLVAISEQGCF